MFTDVGGDQQTDSRVLASKLQRQTAGAQGEKDFSKVSVFGQRSAFRLGHCLIMHIHVNLTESDVTINTNFDVDRLMKLF